MYRPHVVPLPFPFLGLCLKMTALLLPIGSSARKGRPACMWRVRWNTLFFLRVHIKRRNFTLRPNSTPFFEVALWNVASIFYEPLRRPDLLCFLFAFRMTVSQLWYYLRNLDLFGPNIFGGKRKEPSPPEVRSRDGLAERAQKFTVYILKTA